MRNFRIIVLFLLAALSYAWAQSFNIYKDGLNLGTGTVNANFTYRDSDVFSVGPGIVENEDWCWALTVAPTACLNGTAEYTPIILENPASNYTWNIVITRKSDGATRTLNLTINVRPSHAVTFTTNGGLPIPLEQTVLDGDKATEPGVSPTKTGYSFNGWDFDFNLEIKAPVTIPAKWEAIEYNITYEPNGGDGPTSGTYTIETPTITLHTPAKSEHTFLGWYTNPAFSGTAVTSIPLGSTEAKDFFAKWEIKEYTITYELNGGTGAANGTYTNQSPTITLPTAPTMQKNGYTFAGWYTDITLTAGPATEITNGSSGDKTFYAKWNPVPYTITYEQNGGSGATNGTYTIESPTITLPTAPAMQKNGYTFTGWYEDSDFSGTIEIEILTGSSSNKTFYAKWNAITYNITYEPNGGDGPTNGTYTIETPTITLHTPARAEYTFLGWYTNSAFSGTAVTSIPLGSTGAKDFYAKWEIKEYTITYMQNGGSGATNGKYTNESPTITLPTASEMSRTGYTFENWYTNVELTAGPATEITTGSSGNKTFYAKWEAIEYDITYYPDGGSGATNRKYTIEDTPITLPIPTKTEHTFMGWYTDIGLATGPVTTIPTGSTGDKTFYAKWQITEYSITYIQNGGTGATNGIYTNQSPTITLPIASEMSRTGYTFVGWYTDIALTLGPEIEITAGSTGPRTFYAKWNPIDYTVTFNANCPSTSVDYSTCPTPSPASKTVTYDAEIGALELLSELADYDFVGWFTAASGGTKYTEITPYTTPSNTTLYAQWEIKKFTVKWEINSNTIRTDNNVPYGTVLTPPAAPPGYTISSWTPDPSISIKNNTSFIATWSLINYTIEYLPNGGTVESAAPNSYNVESSTITLLPATKPCIGFDGWFDNASFTGSPISSFTPNATNLGNKTFYAKWADKMTPTISDLNYTITNSQYNGYEQPIAPSLTSASSACGLEAPAILYNGISTLPKNAGNYIVQAAFNESDNYKAATITLGTLAIDKATIIPSPNISATISDKVYDATTTAQITDISLDTPLLGEDFISASNYSIISASFDDANAGQAKSVTVSITWNLPNYNTQSWPTNFSTTANITQAIGYLVIQAPESYELSNPIRPIVLEKSPFVTDNLINWEYRRVGTDEYSSTLPRRVGEWIVKAWFNETNNYTGATDSAEFFVERGNSTTVAHNISFGENFDREPDFSKNQLNYFTANACHIKSTDIHITVIEDDIVFVLGVERPRGDLDENGFLRYKIPRTFNKPGQDTVIYTLLSKDGIYSEQDTIIIEIPIPFETIAMQKWNNVLFINNNPLTNGGYEFKEFQWFKNGNTVGEMQFYSAGPSSKDSLNPSDIYKVTMYTKNGMRISTCEGNSKGETKVGLARSNYQKQVLGINGKTAKTGTKVYNLKGRPTKNTPAGIYIVGENE